MPQAEKNSVNDDPRLKRIRAYIETETGDPVEDSTTIAYFLSQITRHNILDIEGMRAASGPDEEDLSTTAIFGGYSSQYDHILGNARKRTTQEWISDVEAAFTNGIDFRATRAALRYFLDIQNSQPSLKWQAGVPQEKRDKAFGLVRGLLERGFVRYLLDQSPGSDPTMEENLRDCVRRYEERYPPAPGAPETMPGAHRAGPKDAAFNR